MKNFNVRLNSIADVKTFAAICCAQDFEIDAASGRYTTDAKSIMGIFSIDLSRPILLTVHGSDSQCEEFYNSVRDYWA